MRIQAELAESNNEIQLVCESPKSRWKVPIQAWAHVDRLRIPGGFELK
jgi:hypothetical protein